MLKHSETLAKLAFLRIPVLLQSIIRSSQAAEPWLGFSSFTNHLETCQVLLGVTRPPLLLMEPQRSLRGLVECDCDSSLVHSSELRKTIWQFGSESQTGWLGWEAGLGTRGTSEFAGRCNSAPKYCPRVFFLECCTLELVPWPSEGFELFAWFSPARLFLLGCFCSAASCCCSRSSCSETSVLC